MTPSLKQNSQQMLPFISAIRHGLRCQRLSNKVSKAALSFSATLSNMMQMRKAPGSLANHKPTDKQTDQSINAPWPTNWKLCLCAWVDRGKSSGPFSRSTTWSARYNTRQPSRYLIYPQIQTRTNTWYTRIYKSLQKHNIHTYANLCTHTININNMFF